MSTLFRNVHRITITPLLVCALLCIGTYIALASADTTTDIDRFVNEYIAKQQIPGVAVLVRLDGKIALARGYGIANLEHQVAVKPETVFQSGSMGKQFTAMAVAMLVDERKLALDDPVSKHLDAPRAWEGMTIRHLLTHTSGLGDYPEKFSLQRDYTEDDLWSMIRQQPLASPPGAQWKYSNLGYVTLGILIRKVTGAFYGDLLQERIFRPLGMTRTRIISERAIIPDRAAGYVLRDKTLQNQSWVSPSLNTTADGALYVTVTDLAKWDEALEAGKFASPAMYREMWTRVRLNDGKTADYGFGWRLPPSPPGHRLIEHSGAWQGFSTHIARYPDDHLTVIALANRAGADTAHIAHAIAAMIRPAKPQSGNW